MFVITKLISIFYEIFAVATAKRARACTNLRVHTAKAVVLPPCFQLCRKTVVSPNALGGFFFFNFKNLIQIPRGCEGTHPGRNNNHHPRIKLLVAPSLLVVPSLLVPRPLLVTPSLLVAPSLLVPCHGMAVRPPQLESAKNTIACTALRLW